MFAAVRIVKVCRTRVVRVCSLCITVVSTTWKRPCVDALCFLFVVGGVDPHLLLEQLVGGAVFRPKRHCFGCLLLATDEADIVDEAIDYFRANVLFRSFEMEGAADRVLAYLTLYIQQVRHHAKRVFMSTQHLTYAASTVLGCCK